MKFDSIKYKHKINNNEIIIFVHDDFIIKVIDQSIVYINDLFYKKYKRLTENILIDLITKNVFLQYYERKFSLFKVYNKDIFKKKRYFNYTKVNMVFDDTLVLYRTVFEDLSIDEIIKLAIEEPIRYDYEIISYSPDKKRRVIIYKTGVGSFSYVVENLYICEDDERIWTQSYAYYEGILSGGFFESIDLIIKELKYIIDWSVIDDM